MAARSLNLYVRGASPLRMLKYGALVSLLIGALAIAATVYGQQQEIFGTVHLETVSDCCSAPWHEALPRGRLTVFLGDQSRFRTLAFDFTVNSLRTLRSDGLLYGLYIAPVENLSEYVPGAPGNIRILFNTDFVGAWHAYDYLQGSPGGIRRWPLPGQTHLTAFVGVEKDDGRPFVPQTDLLVMRGTMALNAP